MSKRVLAIALLLLAMAVPSAPVVEARSDGPDVIVEWNALLQSTLPATAGRRPSGSTRCCTWRCSTP